MFIENGCADVYWSDIIVPFLQFQTKLETFLHCKLKNWLSQTKSQFKTENWSGAFVPCAFLFVYFRGQCQWL